MSSTVTIAGQEIKVVPQGSVSSPLHTVILVMLLMGGAGLMYFSARHVHGTEPSNRVSFYLTTMAWEWFLTGYVLFGVRRYGKSLIEVTGARWNSVKEVVRDIGIALAFWVVALMVRGGIFAAFSWVAGDVAGARAGGPRANSYLDPSVHHRGVLRGDDFPGLPEKAVHRLDRQRAGGRTAFRGDLWSMPHLPGSESRDPDYGVWRIVRSIGAVAKEHASRNDHARAA
jgi:hypothetical protein